MLDIRILSQRNQTNTVLGKVMAILTVKATLFLNIHNSLGLSSMVISFKSQVQPAASIFLINSNLQYTGFQWFIEMTCIVHDGEKVLGWKVICGTAPSPPPPVAMYTYTKTHAQINQKRRFGIKTEVNMLCSPHSAKLRK